MGLDPFSFADALLGVLAQRLARGLCKQCREQYTPTQAELDEMAAAYGTTAFEAWLKEEHPFGTKLWKAKGCQACGQSGYKGRVPLHELLVGSDDLKRAIQHKAPIDEIRGVAAETGMITLLQDGVRKIVAGLTDMQQVLAVCSR
jgi:type II secretory ATPase GspE/PulE/Tfp pilus assembly ATPase PilB-like protein